MKKISVYSRYLFILLIITTTTNLWAQTYLSESTEVLGIATSVLNPPALKSSFKCHGKLIENYCPELLNQQLNESEKGGIWGFVTSYATKKSGRKISTPQSLCQRTELPQDSKYSALNYEKFLSKDNEFQYNYSVSEVFPECLEQFKSTTNSNRKRKMLISNYYLAHNLLEEEEKILMHAVSGLDAFLGDTTLAKVDCSSIRSEKMAQKCLELQKCPSQNKNLHKKQKEQIAINTHKTYREIIQLKREIAKIHSNPPLILKLKKAIRLKQNLYPWLQGKTFKKEVKKLAKKKNLNSISILKAINSEVEISREHLLKNLNKVTRSHHCISGEESNDICQNFDKTLTSLSSFKNFTKKLKVAVPDKEITKVKKEYLQRKILSYQYLDQAHCMLGARRSKEEVNEFAAITGQAILVGTAIVGTTILTGGLALPTLGGVYLSSATIATGAIVAANATYTGKLAYQSYHECKNELAAVKRLKTTTSPNSCPTVSDFENFEVESKYKSCVSGAATTMALGVIPGAAAVAAKSLRKAKLTKGIPTKSSPRTQKAGEYSLAEVNNFHKLNKLQQLQKKAQSSHVGSKKRIIHERAIKNLQNELKELDIDVKRYLSYKREKFDGKFLEAPKREATKEDFDQAVKRRKMKEEQEMVEMQKRKIEQENRLNKDFTNNTGISVEEIPAGSSQADKLFKNWSKELNEKNIGQAIYDSKHGTKHIPAQTKSVNYQDSLRKNVDDYKSKYNVIEYTKDE